MSAKGNIHVERAAARDERRLGEIEQAMPRFRRGVIAKNSGGVFTIKLDGGTTAVDATALAGNTPYYQVGDVVECLQRAGDLIVLGKLSAEPDGTVIKIASSLTLTTSYQDVGGLTYTTPASKRQSYEVTANIEFNQATAGAGILTAQLLVDGVAQTGLVEVAMTNTDKAMGSRTWRIDDPGLSKVIKLQAKKSINAGAANVVATNSQMVVRK